MPGGKENDGASPTRLATCRPCVRIRARNGWPGPFCDIDTLPLCIQCCSQIILESERVYTLRQLSVVHTPRREVQQVVVARGGERQALGRGDPGQSVPKGGGSRMQRCPVHVAPLCAAAQARTDTCTGSPYDSRIARRLPPVTATAQYRSTSLILTDHLKNRHG